MVLSGDGEVTPTYMINMVKLSFKYIRELDQGFEIKLWTEKEADDLVLKEQGDKDLGIYQS